LGVAARYGEYHAGFFDGFGGLWLGLLFSLTLGALVAWRARRYGAARWAAAAWVGGVAALGFPLALVAWIIVRPRRAEQCPSCGSRQSAASAACRRCKSRIGGPAPAGIEIIRPVGG
jgi:hypothetical protein